MKNPNEFLMIQFELKQFYCDSTANHRFYLHNANLKYALYKVRLQCGSAIENKTGYFGTTNPYQGYFNLYLTLTVANPRHLKVIESLTPNQLHLHRMCTVQFHQLSPCSKIIT